MSTNSRHHARDPETRRLEEDARRTKNWKRWGPYLSERQWGTVREDYSADGNVWNYFTHDDARSRAYRWGEDGLLGFCDRECRLCFSVALWNGQDPILKERLFGLTGPEGNHGEDVKEEYFYLDSTPTHSYCKALYKYPHAEFPYDQLVSENAKRSRAQGEFELVDTGVFDGDRYFDVFAEFAKASPDDICIRLTIHNRGPDAAILHVLPQLLFRNRWAWGAEDKRDDVRPRFSEVAPGLVLSEHPTLGRFVFDAEPFGGKPADLLFTENETNRMRLFDAENYFSFVKDAFHDYVIHGHTAAVNPANVGTKVAAYYGLEIAGKKSVTLRLRLRPEAEVIEEAFGRDFDACFAQRIREANQFYASQVRPDLSPEQTNIVRQAYGGLLWSKQFYHYVVKTWLEGDPAQPVPPPQRKTGRNSDWQHLFNRDVISMPDKWEYPWYAAWDLAFHMIPMAHVDPQYAKDQLTLFLREWYMHPQGQLPAYEFNFSDVNPPVHAWACWRVYKISGPRGERDRAFLARTFQKLLINFTWWVNRKDIDGRNIFGGGFLGLDNVGLFDRSKPLPSGQRLDQADATAWMAYYCGTMLSMALELAREDPVYEDVASKFFEHYVAIVDAMNTLGGTGLWDEADGFYYDQLAVDGSVTPLRIRSMVGIIPLFACEVLSDDVIEALPGFKKRMDWFLEHRQDLARHTTYCDRADGDAGRKATGMRLLAVPSIDRLRRVLRYVLDENEFLSPHGVRSLSKVHEKKPVVHKFEGRELRVKYVPGDSDTSLFGGNSNWRGPVWFPLNFLLIEALERYHHFYGDELLVECPTGSGHTMNLLQVADELAARLSSLFLRDKQGGRPCCGEDLRYATNPNWRDLIPFHEFFHGETGKGLGASHQTGWTALVALLQSGPSGRHRPIEGVEQLAETTEPRTAAVP
jgi:hypothetical protein